MLELHVPTLIVATAVVALSSSLALAALWRSNPEARGTGSWALGMLSIGIGGVLIGMRGAISDFASILLGNVAVVVGPVVILSGIRSLIDGARTKRSERRYLVSFVAAFLSLFAIFTYAIPSLRVRVVLVSAAIAVPCTVIVVNLLANRRVAWRSAGNGVVAVFGLIGALMVARAVVALLAEPRVALEDPAHGEAALFLVLILAMSGSAVSLILFAKAIVEAELRVLSLAVTQSSSSVMITDTHGVIEYVNPAFLQRTGFTTEEVVGKNPRILKSGHTDANEYRELWATISAGKVWHGEFHNRAKDGELFWEIASVSPVIRPDGVTTHYVAVKEDITALKEAQARITELAHQDALTGVPNRRAFDARLREACRVSARLGESVGMILCDVDFFKDFNDTYGHPAGDDCLVRVARALTSATPRAGDFVARYGGEEFAVILPSSSQDGLRCVTERIAAAIETEAIPHRASSVSDHVTLSGGAALVMGSAESAYEVLLKRCDTALYQAKAAGRNRFVIDTQTEHRSVVLALDDEVDNLELLARIVGRRYELRTFTEPSQALAEVMRAPPGVIIVDHKLASTTGVAFAQQIRDKGLRIPIVMITGFPELDEITYALQSQLLYRLHPKPIEADELLQLLQNVIEQGPRTAP